MSAVAGAVKVLLVEDSIADSTLILEVFEDEKIAADVAVVRDGIEAMQYLKREGQYEAAPIPDIVILDLNLPRMDGREVLSEMKSTPGLETIPIVILTTSMAEEDIVSTYKLRANCYVTKPIDLEQFVKIVKSIDKFWFTAVQYPPK
jgi:two-component system, chemotaxis family, response regulator Rcp1